MAFIGCRLSLALAHRHSDGSITTKVEPTSGLTPDIAALWFKSSKFLTAQSYYRSWLHNLWPSHERAWLLSTFHQTIRRLYLIWQHQIQLSWAVMLLPDKRRQETQPISWSMSSGLTAHSGKYTAIRTCSNLTGPLRQTNFLFCLQSPISSGPTPLLQCTALKLLWKC